MKQYTKPEINDREQLRINEAIAACDITFTNRWQNFDQRKIPSGEFLIENYGYESEAAAYYARAGAGDYGLVGKIYAIDFVDDQQEEHKFYWEDFNENYKYDTSYSATNDYGQHYESASDNLQSVSGTPMDPNVLIGPISGLPIRS